MSIAKPLSHSPLVGALLVGLFAALTALPGITALPPLDRDESRFMQASVQMLETGDYVSISFQDAERNKKPAGSYWAQAASVAAFSSVETRAPWAHRTPSLVAAVVGVLFVYFIGRRLFDPDTALFGALLMAGAPSLAGEATIAKSDALLFASVALMQLGLAGVVASLRDEAGPRRTDAALFWIGLGLGALIKGPVTPMIGVLTVAGLSLSSSRIALWKGLRPISGVLVAAAIVAPWTLAITLETEGRFIAEAMGTDGLAKVTEAQEEHGAPPGLHLALLPVLFWPAAPFLLSGAASALRAEKERPGDGLPLLMLAAWAVPAWLVFEISTTKLPHYTLPLYPALALIAARMIARPPERLDLVRLSAAFYALTGVLFAALLIAIPAFGSSAHSWRSPPLYADVAAGALIVATLTTVVLAWRGALRAAAVGAAAGGAILAWSVLEITLPAADRLDLSRRIAAELDEADLHPRLDGAPDAVLTGYYEPSAVFLLGTNTLLAEPGPAGAAYADRNGAAVVEAAASEAFCAALARAGGGARAFSQLEGFNYSKGREVRISFYRRAEGVRGCV
ncbi:MAG: glycosyltransferase family 39 protein [Pseudomonadota bacterium]